MTQVRASLRKSTRLQLRDRYVETLLGAVLITAAIHAGALAQGNLAHALGPTIAPEALVAGQKGYGLTVVKGSQPSRFAVEFIGIQRGFRGRGTLILVRVTEPSLRAAGAVSGMSGSPIYFDGQLAGAYAYGWRFGRRAVVGVTPIGEMLQDSSARSPHVLAGSGSRSRAPTPLRADASVSPWIAQALGPVLAQQTSHTTYPALYPTEVKASPTHPAPLASMSSAPEQALTLSASGGLGPSNSAGVAASTGGAYPASESSPALTPGSAIAVQLVGGDYNLAAYGTLTAGFGDKDPALKRNTLLGFGHPLFSLGAVELPVHRARIVHIFESQEMSFKFGESGAPAGTLVEDLPTGIVVDGERVAPVLRTSLTLSGEAFAPLRWQLRVAQHPQLTPALVLGALAAAIEGRCLSSKPTLVELRTRFVSEQFGPQTFNETVHFPRGTQDLLRWQQTQAVQAVNLAYDSAFAPERIDNLDLRVRVRVGSPIATLTRASVLAKEAVAGEDLAVDLDILSPEGEHLRRRHTLRVPHSAQGKRLELWLQPGSASTPATPRPEDLASLWQALRDQSSDTALVISAYTGYAALRGQNHNSGPLPGLILRMLQSAQTSPTAHLAADAAVHTIPLPYAIRGQARLSVPLKEADRWQP